jgi:hypothetical protein
MADIRINAKKMLESPKRTQIIKRFADYICLTEKTAEIILERVAGGHIPDKHEYRFIQDCYTDRGDITIFV